MPLLTNTTAKALDFLSTFARIVRIYQLLYVSLRLRLHVYVCVCIDHCKPAQNKRAAAAQSIVKCKQSMSARRFMLVKPNKKFIL